MSKGNVCPELIVKSDIIGKQRPTIDDKPIRNEYWFCKKYSKNLGTDFKERPSCQDCVEKTDSKQEEKTCATCNHGSNYFDCKNPKRRCGVNDFTCHSNNKPESNSDENFEKWFQEKCLVTEHKDEFYKCYKSALKTQQSIIDEQNDKLTEWSKSLADESNRIENARDYLMEVELNKLDIGEIFIALGYNRSGTVK